MIFGKFAPGGELRGKRILLVDEDVRLCQMLVLIFERAGATVYTAHKGREGLFLFFNQSPDLMILDVNLPDMDGWEICRQIRLVSHAPILMLTGAKSTEDVIRGLDLGADDYVTKPFNLDVLVARSGAVLRRSAAPVRKEPEEVYSDGYLTVDFSQRRVFAGGQPVQLTGTEFLLLSCLVQNGGDVLTYGQILEWVWGRADLDAAEYIHLYVQYLRNKLEPDPQHPRYLLTAQGIGYRFERDVAYQT